MTLSISDARDGGMAVISGTKLVTWLKIPRTSVGSSVKMPWTSVGIRLSGILYHAFRLIMIIHIIQLSSWDYILSVLDDSSAANSGKRSNDEVLELHCEDIYISICILNNDIYILI